MARHSVVWIGPGDGWAERGLDRDGAIDVTWSAGPDDTGTLASEHFDLALLEDHNEAEAALRELRRLPACPPLLVLSNELEAGRKQCLIGAGADHVLLAPRDADPTRLPGELARLLERLARARRARRVEPVVDIPGVIAHSSAFRATLQLARHAAGSSATVLLGGETGSGKEIIARAIHRLGPRQAKPFVAVNCAAFTDTLLESELFGHVRGAFTGADRSKPGLFEAADGGTLFLDEIGETSGPLQAKLLRALQEREIRPVGATQVRRFDARVIVASNRDLEAEAQRGHFRTDLYYRVAVFPIYVPPLRERSTDILALAAYFLERHAAREAVPGCRLAASAERALLAHDWPGNVRELENEILRALALAEPGELLGPEHFSARLAHSKTAHLYPAYEPGQTLRARVARFERLVIRDALDRNGGRRTSTARELGLTREGLHKKMKRLHVE